MTVKSIRILLLMVAPVLVAIFGCTRLTSVSSVNPNHKAADYVVFGPSVFCGPTDFLCLEEQFDRSLGQTRKRHVRENGRPHTLTLLTNGEALAEWRFRRSDGRVTMTYDIHGIAREWRYEGSPRALYGPVSRPVSPTGFPSQAPLERGR
jgi:hypothetical protein